METNEEIYQAVQDARIALARVPHMPITEEEKDAVHKTFYALGLITGIANK
jgi:hypothetical protein